MSFSDNDEDLDNLIASMEAEGSKKPKSKPEDTKIEPSSNKNILSAFSVNTNIKEKTGERIDSPPPQKQQPPPAPTKSQYMSKFYNEDSFDKFSSFDKPPMVPKTAPATASTNKDKDPFSAGDFGPKKPLTAGAGAFSSKENVLEDDFFAQKPPSTMSGASQSIAKKIASSSSSTLINYKTNTNAKEKEDDFLNEFLVGGGGFKTAATGAITKSRSQTQINKDDRSNTPVPPGFPVYEDDANSKFKEILPFPRNSSAEDLIGVGAGAGDKSKDILPFLNSKLKKSKGTKKSEQNLLENPGGIGAGGDQRLLHVKSTLSTLQVPSHLIDEEELKSMSSSLDILYKNQMKMIEKSYQEQMDCMAQSHARREEMLRQEIEHVQKDYEMRIGRIIAKRSELGEDQEDSSGAASAAAVVAAEKFSELKEMVQYFFHDFGLKFKELSFNVENSVGGQIKECQSSLLNLNANLNLNFLSPEKLSSLVAETIGRDLNSKMGHFSVNFTHEINEKERKNSENFNLILGKLNALNSSSTSFKGGIKQEDLEAFYKTFTDFNTKFTEQNQDQKKAQEVLIKKAVRSLSQTIEASTEETQGKKEKMTQQMKEFRKELRRFLFVFDAKQQNIQKSQICLEAEQKQILNGIRDLSSVVQFSSKNNYNFMDGQIHESQPASANLDFEIRLLREEKKSLSESIAKLSVEKQILNEERLNFERERMEFDMEKGRIKDLEMSLKRKFTEAEELKRKANEARSEESRLTAEANYKMSQVEKERANLKEQVSSIEQQLRIREQKYFADKTELSREREFIEKLRDQLLCPGCMKNTAGTHAGIGNGLITQPPLNYNLIRATIPESQGQGQSLSQGQTPRDRDEIFNPSNFYNESFLEEDKNFLDNLYQKHFLNRY